MIHLTEVDINHVPNLARFDHPLNIEVGKARVIYAEACTPRGGLPCVRGWVLPGGMRTADRVTATLAAERMDRVAITGYLTIPT